MQLLTELQYLGTVDYFAKLLQYGNVQIEQHEHYVKRTFRNRCHILGANGVLPLSIPLAKGKNQQQSIREVRLAQQNNWQTLHWRSIQSAYGNAPFFEYYADELKAVFEQKMDGLFEFNLALTEFIVEVLQLEITLSFSSVYEKTPAENVVEGRNLFLPTQTPNEPSIAVVPYQQVFKDKHGFVPHLSILDLMFSCGPSSYQILEEMGA